MTYIQRYPQFMKGKGLLVFGLLVLGVTCWLIYVYLTRPNTRKIEESLSDNVTGNETPTRDSYDSLIRVDIANNKTFLLDKAAYSEIWNNQFPFSKTKFNFDQTERILKILNDSSTYMWGEIGTPYFDKTIIFYGEKTDVIGYTIVSFDGQTRSFPDVALTKWGALSPEGFKDLVTAIRTE
jgi:hypothetical protein